MNILEYENYHETISHGDIIFPYNTYLCSIPYDFSKVPLHWHEEMEVIYIKKGQGIVTVDFKSYNVKSPSVVLILPGQLHSIEQLEDYSMEYENIIFNPSMLIPKQADCCSTDFILPLLNRQITVPTVFNKLYPYYNDVVSSLDCCDNISMTRPQGYQLYIKSQLFNLFFVLNNRCKLDAKPKSNHTALALDKMKIILKYIENNYMNKISIYDVANLIDYSESHFMKYFKNTMGTTFIEYLKDYRLTMASRLLASSDSSILDIANEVGFDNLSYFNRSFKKKYHTTPLRYRKENNS
ncbi:AraC family transcriptional regulator [Lachnobacterium bovis]|uniref:AraC-type DNA-binding protein n=1 Tax=Lachnobacterium bovis TaxID=140626 RepID=A0A1H9U537_9FIRM|nr:AraC family transcriptional regulator [Lachnobacterium bovis]SES04351.1 AraC-type DNA-binding protein [Lachnobacterium bovis]